MKPMKNIVVSMVAIVTMLLTSTHAYATYWLFKNGKSKYQIVVTEGASASEQKAAFELQDYLFQISGVQLPIISNPDAPGRHVYVGYTSKIAKLTGAPQPNYDDESFTYRRVGGDLLIWGGSQRGTMYGVFTFLERELGVHWLAPDCTMVPKRSKWRLSKLNHSESPAIAFRSNYYFVTKSQPVWSAHVKENMRGPISNEYGNLEGFWGCHTMGQLLPVSEFYLSHPEYFCLRDGKRLSQDEQLCLSNPEVLQICKERLLNVIRGNPGYRIYDLSQNDNRNFCQCDKCKQMENQYGGHSGLIVWFVNQVADAVREEFPDKYVGTFAYQYSRKPPVSIVPRENVVIRLCSIECCFAHPLTSDCPENVEFMNDLRGWAAIATHLFIWDYIVDFKQFLAPWPNFQVLAPNIRAFCENNAIGVFEEAAYQSLGGEFEEMKSWTVNQLLWNPYQATDSLVNIFINGFYGNVAKQVLVYYHLCQSLVKPDIHFGIFIREGHEVYNEEFLRQAFIILDEAQNIVEDEVVGERLERVRMQPLYLYCMRHKEESKRDGKWDELISLMHKYNARPHENQVLEDFELQK